MCPSVLSFSLGAAGGLWHTVATIHDHKYFCFVNLYRTGLKTQPELALNGDLACLNYMERFHRW